MTQMDLNVQISARDTVIVVAGEIDVLTSPALRDCLRSLAAERVTRIVVDLSGVTFAGSAAICVLLEARKRQAATGGSLTVRNVSPLVRRVFEIAAVDRLLGSRDTEHQATG